MPLRTYLVTVTVTRSVSVDTATELCLDPLEPRSMNGSGAEWHALEREVMSNSFEFSSGIIMDNVTSVELDEEAMSEFPPQLDRRSDDPHE